MLSKTYASVEACIVAYALASLVHFAHNAAHLREYPNMPPWLSARTVWLAWLAITMIGVIGYWLYRYASRWIGSLIIVVYALLGYGGLDHYAIAPVGAHSIEMHATIAIEVVAATVLLIFIGRRARES